MVAARDLQLPMIGTFFMMVEGEVIGVVWGLFVWFGGGWDLIMLGIVDLRCHCMTIVYMIGFAKSLGFLLLGDL